MVVTGTHVSNVDPTPEFEAVCAACGVIVISFVGKPHMWKWTITGGDYSRNFLSEQICVSCVTDIIKFKTEVLAKKNK